MSTVRFNALFKDFQAVRVHLIIIKSSILINNNITRLKHLHNGQMFQTQMLICVHRLPFNQEEESDLLQDVGDNAY